ncbi:hypothetical protein [Variovorax terrae]|uniref:Uncharacterized protein n=1 Tax=Variovorax terrae TaxID=2923278 RepID=A0A9X1VQY9_9BURK|nr:hypothetical protein [Variovorax terrae]MCJ0761755.1 hypothetical protein [Variovorax terrae]
MPYTKTETGQQALKDRSVALTPRQRSAFILFDGKRSLVEVLKATAGLGVTAEDVEYLVQTGLLAGAPGDPGIPLAEPAAAPAGGQASAQERYQRAYPIATQLTASLGLRGFRLNLAVEATGSYEQLLALAPKIREAVGPEKFQPLERALNS